MQNFINFIVKFKEYITFVALVIVSLSLISMGSVSQIGGFRTILIGSLGHLQGAFAWLPNPAAIQSENRALRELNLQLSTEVTKMRQSVLENERLKRMLKFKNTSDKELISCEMVGRSTVEMRNYITVNTGKSDGISKGMTARTDAGIVGSIIVSTDKYSLIELIENRNVKVSGKIVRTNIEGILSWNGDDFFVLNNIPGSFDVQVGDEIVTSNFSNKYPPNIPVGKIVKVENDKSSLFLKVLVKPFVNFQSLEQIFIIKQIADPERQRIIDEIELKLKNKRSEK